MKYAVEIYFDEDIWNGAMPDEGEDPLYDKYCDWMNNGDGQEFMPIIDDYMRDWDYDFIVDGGSLSMPNGVYWEAKIEVHPNLLADVQSELANFCERLERDVQNFNCPIKPKIGWNIYDDSNYKVDL